MSRAPACLEMDDRLSHPGAAWADACSGCRRRTGVVVTTCRCDCTYGNVALWASPSDTLRRTARGFRAVTRSPSGRCWAS